MDGIVVYYTVRIHKRKGGREMLYTMKRFDTPVLRFSADSGAESNLHILWTTEDRSLLPLDMENATDAGVLSWIKHRSIPKNRAYVDTLLSAMGLSINRPLDVLRVSKGLSLNDCYWVVEDGFEGSFAQNNLYDNRFNRVLGQIAFTGYGSSDISLLNSSPEFTTNGMLPKCWRRESGIIKLYKGGTEGASNTGNEPYSEFYAAKIAQMLGIEAVDYSLSMWKGKLCSVCDLFTSKDVSFVPVGRIVRSGGMKAVKEYYASLGDDYVKALNDMVVFDAVIYNTDRHFGNFGFLVDSKTNTIIAPAPLFDHGNSLFNFAGRDALESVDAMKKYADTLLPCIYDDFVQEARAVISHEQKNQLRSLLDFRLPRHSRYNLPKERLALIEKLVISRVKEIVE